MARVVVATSSAATPCRQEGLPTALSTLPANPVRDCRIPVQANTHITGTLGPHRPPKAKGMASGAIEARPRKAGNVTRRVSCVAS
jgi:hypothetical protein